MNVIFTALYATLIVFTIVLQVNFVGMFILFIGFCLTTITHSYKRFKYIPIFLIFIHIQFEACSYTNHIKCNSGIIMMIFFAIHMVSDIVFFYRETMLSTQGMPLFKINAFVLLSLFLTAIPLLSQSTLEDNISDKLRGKGLPISIKEKAFKASKDLELLQNSDKKYATFNIHNHKISLFNFFIFGGVFGCALCHIEKSYREKKQRIH